MTDLRPFVSRAGLKLDHALREFQLDVTGFVCADFGCNAGGFTDCLLQHGATKVFAIDTGYGMLAWKLRNDPRVVVMERTNALHSTPPEDGVDLVVMDLAWTPQRLGIPAARRWLKSESHIVTLVKPHYELDDPERRELLHEGRLAPMEAERIVKRLIEVMPEWGIKVLGCTKSPITGAKSARGAPHSGNLEYLVLAQNLV